MKFKQTCAAILMILSSSIVFAGPAPPTFIASGSGSLFGSSSAADASGTTRFTLDRIQFIANELINLYPDQVAVSDQGIVTLRVMTDEGEKTLEVDPNNGTIRVL